MRLYISGICLAFLVLIILTADHITNGTSTFFIVSTQIQKLVSQNDHNPHSESDCDVSHSLTQIGQLETTMLNTSARSANLRALLADNPALRASVLELVSVMEQIDLEDIRGFRLASILDVDSPSYMPRSKPQAGNLADFHHALLCEYLGRSRDLARMPRDAQFLKEISKNGVCYGTSSTSTFKNSSIIFSNRNPTDPAPYAAIATQLFEYCWLHDDKNRTRLRGVFLVVRILEPIDSEQDPYRRYPFGGFLCVPTRREIIISLAQIQSHSVLTQMIEGRFSGYVHVLPVDRVRSVFNFSGYKMLTMVCLANAPVRHKRVR